MCFLCTGAVRHNIQCTKTLILSVLLCYVSILTVDANVFMHIPENTMKMRNMTSKFWRRPGGDRGGGANGAAAGAAEPGCCQNLFRKGATCAAGSRPRLNPYYQCRYLAPTTAWALSFQICRVFQLRPDGKLEQTVSMATDNKPPTQHLHIVYRRAF